MRRAERPILAAKPNQRWSIDFTSDQLSNGRRFRTFNVVDDCSRESLSIYVARSIPGWLVVTVLNDQLKQRGGRPLVIVCDNGPEFIGRAMEIWAEENGVKLHFIQQESRCRTA